MVDTPLYPVYPVDAIAKLLNLTPRRVQQLVRDEIIPKPEKGQYDLIRCVRGYVKYLQKRAEGRIEPRELDDERTRLVKAQAEHKELEVAALHRSLLPFDEVVTGWQQLVAAFRSKCLALPSKLAPLVVTMNEIGEIQEHIDSGIREALEDLSRFELARGSPARHSGSGQRRKTPAKAQPKRVGRPARRAIG